MIYWQRVARYTSPDDAYVNALHRALRGSEKKPWWLKLFLGD